MAKLVLTNSVKLDNKVVADLCDLAAAAGCDISKLLQDMVKLYVEYRDNFWAEDVEVEDEDFDDPYFDKPIKSRPSKKIKTGLSSSDKRKRGNKGS